MAGELQVVGPGTGLVIYAVIHDKNGLAWYTTTPVFEAYNAAHWAAYAINFTEQGTSGYYTATMPAVVAGSYNIDIRQRIGATPVIADPSIGSSSMAWNGTLEVSAASKMLLDEDQIPVSVVTGSWFDLLLRAAARSSNFTIVGSVATFTLPGGHVVTMTVDTPSAPTTGVTTVT